SLFFLSRSVVADRVTDALIVMQRHRWRTSSDGRTRMIYLISIPMGRDALMATDSVNFASPEVASFWRAIRETVDRLLATLDGLSQDEINWRPAAPEANPLSILAIHTMGNVEENILETLCGQPVNRQRDREFQAS